MNVPNVEIINSYCNFKEYLMKWGKIPYVKLNTVLNINIHTNK